MLRAFQIGDGKKKIPFPETNFEVNVTASAEGVIFDIMRKDRIAFTNICCFEAEGAEFLLAILENILSTIKRGPVKKQPVLPNWIYKVPVDPFALSHADISVAEEVESYIYYSLYLARRKK